MKSRATAALLAAITACAPSPVEGEPTPGFVCGSRDSIIALIEKPPADELIMLGISNGGALLEIWANPSGHFLLVATQPGTKTSCVVAEGHSLQILRQSLQAERKS